VVLAMSSNARRSAGLVLRDRAARDAGVDRIAGETELVIDELRKSDEQVDIDIADIAGPPIEDRSSVRLRTWRDDRDVAGLRLACWRA